MPIDSLKYQKQLLQYLQSITDAPLSTLVTDNCSELSRMLGCWVLAQEECIAHIFKGTSLPTVPAHDLLVLETQSEIQIWDPTIWQLAETAETIFVASSNSMTTVPALLHTHYGGGFWHLAETLDTQVCATQMNLWEEVIQANIGDADASLSP